MKGPELLILCFDSGCGSSDSAGTQAFKEIHSKVEGNKFVKMDESLIAEAVVVLSAPPVAPLVLGLSSP